MDDLEIRIIRDLNREGKVVSVFAVLMLVALVFALGVMAGKI